MSSDNPSTSGGESAKRKQSRAEDTPEKKTVIPKGNSTSLKRFFLH